MEWFNTYPWKEVMDFAKQGPYALAVSALLGRPLSWDEEVKCREWAEAHSPAVLQDRISVLHAFTSEYWDGETEIQAEAQVRAREICARHGWELPKGVAA